MPFKTKKLKAAYERQRYAEIPAVRDKKLARNKRWAQRKSSLPKLAAIRRRWLNKPAARCADRTRATINCALARNAATKTGGTFALVGCPLLQFKQHIESLFLPGMSWANRHLWHIDHDVPISAFDLSHWLGQHMAFHYLNCQPLWAKANLLKGNRV